MSHWGKRRIGLRKRRIIFFSFLIFFIFLFQTFIYIEKQLQPILISIAQTRVKQIATNAVNDAISKKIAQNTNFKDLIEFEMDQQGKITAAIFNYSEFARIVGEATVRVEDTLNDLDKIVEPIKVGAAFNSDLLADFGPTVPITIVPIGSVQVNPRTIYQNAGINVVVMTVLIDISAEVQVVIPFVTAPTVITSSVPIAHTQIFGEVPQFYYDGKGTYYGQYPSSSQTPPIQIIPGAPITPNDSQSQYTNEAIPSSVDSIDSVDPIMGLEEFYPLIPRIGIPTTVPE